MNKAVAGFLIYAFTTALMAGTVEDEAWLEDDSEERALAVNEGQLNFIAPIDAPPVLHSDTRFKVSTKSLEDGWVAMRQCYSHLDAVGRVDLVYQYQEMKNLHLLEHHNIAAVRVGQNKVELEDVIKGARLCVSADVRVLNWTGRNLLSLKNGPYHRKFFDGFYPYHVSLAIEYPKDALQFHTVSPSKQRGFKVDSSPGHLAIDTWFEGELLIEILFTALTLRQ